ncbi:MAG: DAK2 domain-containing protein [Thermoleophilaceae bacterium]
MAHRAAQDLAHMPTPRLGAEASPHEQDELIAEVLERALDAANEAVERGPEQLAVLREAGVVDAGAYGLTVILAGVVAALRGEAPELAHREAPAGATTLPEHESSTFRYCTNFAVTGRSLRGQSFVSGLERLGDSVLVVGDERTLRVHVHTDDPEAAVAIFAAGGSGVAPRRRRHARAGGRAQRPAGREHGLGDGDRPGETAQAACAAVAVASGAGVKRLYQELGAFVVDGGPTMNPSTYELLAGVRAAGGAEAIVLPNSPNVIMAAERAAELSDLPARVVADPGPAGGPGRPPGLRRRPLRRRRTPMPSPGRRRACCWAEWPRSARDDPAGALRGRRRRGLPRRRAGGLGRAGADAAHDAGGGGRGSGARHLHRRGRGPAGRGSRGGRGARRRRAGAPGRRPARMVVAAVRGMMPSTDRASVPDS